MKDKDFKKIFDDDSSNKKKKKKSKKKDKSKKSKKDGRSVFIYADFISAIMAMRFNDDIDITRYHMKKGQYSIVEKDGKMNIGKIKSINFSMNETSLDVLSNNEFTKKRIKEKEEVCYSGTTYTIVTVKIDDLIDIINYTMSLTSDKGSEISKIFMNLYGIHDASVIGKNKKQLGMFIRA